MAAQPAKLADVCIAWGVAGRSEHRRLCRQRSGGGRARRTPNDQVALALSAARRASVLERAVGPYWISAMLDGVEHHSGSCCRCVAE